MAGFQQSCYGLCLVRILDNTQSPDLTRVLGMAFNLGLVVNV